MSIAPHLHRQIDGLKELCYTAYTRSHMDGNSSVSDGCFYRFTVTGLCERKMIMIKILFVCHGNICRSPMAEFIMKDIVKRNHREQDFEIASAATSSEELGNPVYPPARRKLAEHGLRCDGKTARQMTISDYHYYDLLIVMDYNNLKNAKRIIGSDTGSKLHLLMEYTPEGGTVSDPWYTRNFEKAYNDILRGCEGLFAFLCRSL